MSAILSIIGSVVVAIFEVIAQYCCIAVGEVALFLVTFGRHKPRWDAYTGDGGGDWVFLSEMSFWAGIVTLCAVGLLVKWIFFPADF